jgi:hypothetical protein
MARKQKEETERCREASSTAAVTLFFWSRSRLWVGMSNVHGVGSLGPKYLFFVRQDRTRVWILLFVLLWVGGMVLRRKCGGCSTTGPVLEYIGSISCSFVAFSLSCLHEVGRSVLSIGVVFASFPGLYFMAASVRVLTSTFCFCTCLATA